MNGLPGYIEDGWWADDDGCGRDGLMYDNRVAKWLMLLYECGLQGGGGVLLLVPGFGSLYSLMFCEKAHAHIRLQTLKPPNNIFST